MFRPVSARLPAAVFAAALSIPATAFAATPDPHADATYSGLTFRHLGPALMSGRIADLAIHPHDRNTWYVAVGSGGVWKTTNAGTTMEPIFDDQGSYSIGCVTIDPNDPEVIWVGSGENVSGRHVGYGDGVYRSLDGGVSWENLGLRSSEHISKILVDPRDSNVVYVAAEGPLWSAGGERGVFKSTDRGATWSPSLEISEDTGVASLVMDPNDPDTLWAASYQRRRTVWSLLAGGPESGIWKSTDAGATWREVTQGLPSGDLGKIGLAVSPFDSSVVYATVEAKPDEAGFYRSLDGGETWERRNGYHSGGTGPHYYQEIYASPHHRGRVYQMDVFIHVTEDDGANFRMVDGGQDKHSDNHALAFRDGDPNYLLAGTDAGLYESFDLGRTWKFVTNLPVTQIYKADLDNDFPAYNMVGGTQDNGTIYGPVRTFNQHGVRDQDWKVPYGADGYDTAIDPSDPNIVYVAWQGGHPLRFDRRTGELTEIQPQPEPGDAPERWNWDAPIRVSPHDPATLFYASQRVWKSTDRGDSWTPISGDLTRGDLRYELPVGGRRQSVDALWGNTAMSIYATLTTVDESPEAQGLLYAGSDDGVIQVSEDGGATWRRSQLPKGTPERAFVNQIRASVHDADVAFAALDNHKEGDYRPILLRTDDRGRTWTSIVGDLGDRFDGRQLVWATAQDHVDPKLWFVAAEYGVYWTRDDGAHWTRIAGMPHLGVRDLEIQRRENDLVAATFGRGFYVLDDYSALRGVTEETLKEEAKLFPVRDALWFVPELALQNRAQGSKGSDYWSAENPAYGATFTYHLSEGLQSQAETRLAAEKQVTEADPSADLTFPSLDDLREEFLSPQPKVVLTVRNGSGDVVRRVEGPASSGFHRVAWDLRYPDYEQIELGGGGDRPPWWSPPVGPLVVPGSFSVQLSKVVDNQETALGEAQSFDVTPIFEASLPTQGAEQVLTFQKRTGSLYQHALRAASEVEEINVDLRHLRKAIEVSPSVDLAMLTEVQQATEQLAQLSLVLRGDPVLGGLQEPSTPNILGRIYTVIDGHWSSRNGPTQTHRRNIDIAAEQLHELLPQLEALDDTVDALVDRLLEQGGRWGRE